MRLLITLFLFTMTLCAASSEEQVRAAMDSLKQAMIARDGATLNKLLHDDLTYTHSAGQVEHKADVMKSVTSGKANIQSLEFIDPTIHVYGNTALYKSRVNLTHSPAEVIHMDILHVWLKTPGGWRLVARQATRLSK